MSYQEQLKAKLEQHIDFRERRFRAKGLMILTLRHCGLEDKYNYKSGLFSNLTMEEAIRVAKIYDNFRHEYDAVQKAYPHLQGKDYPDGKNLAQAKQIEFGYEVGYYNDLSKLEVYK